MKVIKASEVPQWEDEVIRDQSRKIAQDLNELKVVLENQMGDFLSDDEFDTLSEAVSILEDVDSGLSYPL